MGRSIVRSGGCGVVITTTGMVVSIMIFMVPSSNGTAADDCKEDGVIVVIGSISSTPLRKWRSVLSACDDLRNLFDIIGVRIVLEPRLILGMVQALDTKREENRVRKRMMKLVDDWFMVVDDLM